MSSCKILVWRRKNIILSLPTAFRQLSLELVFRNGFVYFCQEKKHCYYHGTVRGVEGSKVIASTCRGFRCVQLNVDSVVEC